ncbi:hypothetical protein [Halosimplex sp. TS25]|uniref:hypothetical protein n=1 Tax=Halosimplex rarum TaxID=3396619 RepID=UPI0039EAE5FD
MGDRTGDDGDSGGGDTDDAGRSRDVSDGTTDSAEHPDTVDEPGQSDGTGEPTEGESDRSGRGGYSNAADADDVDGTSGEPPDEAAVSAAERAVMVVALAVTVGLFAFALWQALAASAAVDPSANVTSVQGATENATYYGVTLRNEGDAGLVSATVAVDCPRPSRQVTFENVPANAHRNATVRCPNGTTPTADVVSWIPA